MDKRFMTVNEFAELTGLKPYYIRKRCKTGKLPCINSGRKFMVNVDKALKQLEDESEQ